eukprot:IDg4396t1
MTDGVFTCNHCTLNFDSTCALGRHIQALNVRRASTGVTPTSRSNLSSTEQYSNDQRTLSEEALADMHTPVNVSDETFTLYSKLGDTSEPVFDDITTVHPSHNELHARTRQLLQFCCGLHYNTGDIAKLYRLTTGNSSECACADSVRSQFPTGSSFASYVERSRKLVVNSQGCRRALIRTSPQERSFLGLKSVGSFMDCSFCLMPSLEFTSDSSYDDSIEPQEICEISAENDVYLVQTGSSSARARNVINTISRQLIAVRTMLTSAHGFNEECTSFNSSDAHLSKRYLKRVSATLILPSLASFHGLATPPYHLYTCVRFDKLHVVDLGVERMLPDMAFTTFARASYNKGVISKSALMRVSNQRFSDLTRAFGLNLQPFRMNANEVHANMTGLLRRTITPFLWPVLLGLRPEVKPDEDDLLRAALLIDNFQRIWRGVNEPWAARNRTKDKIEHIQTMAFETGVMVSQSLSLRINTKLHRLMRHAADHLLRFGCSRRGDTDQNETMHKTTKACYQATNKKMNQLTDQVLTASRQQYFNDSPLSSTMQAQNSAGELLHSGVMSAQLNSTAHSAAISLAQLDDVVANVSTECAKASALAITEIDSYCKVWVELKQLTIQAEFPWLSTAEHNLRRSSIAKEKVAVIRRLRSVPCHPDNSSVVQEFGHERLAFALRRNSPDDVHFDCVPEGQIKRALPIVRDFHDLSLRFSIAQRAIELPDTADERRLARFFGGRVTAGVTIVAYHRITRHRQPSPDDRVQAHFSPRPARTAPLFAGSTARATRHVAVFERWKRLSTVPCSNASECTIRIKIRIKIACARAPWPSADTMFESAIVASTRTPVSARRRALCIP